MISDDAQVTYTAVLTPGEDGWVCAQIAEVPEAISQGRTVEEAKAHVTEALELALAWRRQEGEALPARMQVTRPRPMRVCVPNLPSTAEREEIRKLRAENFELRRANEILTARAGGLDNELRPFAPAAI